jgi:hypothetical protein
MKVKGDTGNVEGEKNRGRERNSKKTMGVNMIKVNLHVRTKHHNEIPHFYSSYTIIKERQWKSE